MPGPQGPKGDPGTPATVQIGTVTTLAPGSAATATNSGTDSAVILNLGIPQGAPGAGGTGSGDMLRSTYDPDGDGKVISAVNADAAPWTGISGKPSTFPSTIAGVTGLQAALDAKAAAADLTAHTGNTSNPHAVTKAQVGLGNVTNDAQVKRTEMGAASGVATLGADGKVPAGQLPANSGGLTAVSHDASLTGDGTPGNPLSVVGGGGGTAILGTGNTAVENPPAGTTETMHPNIYGTYLELRWTVLQATTLRRLTFQLRNWYGGSNTVNVAVYRTTDGSNTASAGTFVADANIPSVGGTMAAYTSVLPADLAVNPGDRLIVRLSASDGGMVEVKSRPDGQSLPYALPAGVLAYQGGAGQSDSGAVGTRVPHVTFLAQTTKNTIGPAFTVGATAERPTGSATGDQHYDTTLGKPVWWSGSAWKDATGTTV